MDPGRRRNLPLSSSSLAALIGGPITAGELTIGLIIYVIISILLDIP